MGRRAKKKQAKCRRKVYDAIAPTSFTQLSPHLTLVSYPCPDLMLRNRVSLTA